MQTQNTEGHVYLIRATGTNRFKIGMARLGRMQTRFDELNHSQSAYPLEIVRVIDVADRHQVEAELHQRFKRDRRHGGWFEFPRGIREVERAMTQLENPKVATPSLESWRLMLLISCIVCLLFAYQNHTRERSPSSPSSYGDWHNLVSTSRNE
jgi:Meiotically up-regulated gene 113